MAYGKRTELVLTFAGNPEDTKAVNESFTGFSFHKIAPFEGQSYNGIRLNTWGVLKDASNVTVEENCVRFETDGIPEQLFKSVSKQFPKVKFRLEFCSSEANIFGTVNFYKGASKVYSFEKVGAVAFDKNLNIIASGAVLSGNKKDIYIYKGISEKSTDEKTVFEVYQTTGELIDVDRNDVEWKPCGK